MYRFLVVLLLLDAFILAVAVLLQAGKGGGLAASFGGAGSSPNSLLGSREAGNLLTKASWISGGVFLGLAFVLQLMSSSLRTQGSVLDQMARPAAPAAAAPTPTNSGNTPLQPIAPAKPPAEANKQPPAKQPPAKPPTDKQQ